MTKRFGRNDLLTVARVSGNFVRGTIHFETIVFETPGVDYNVRCKQRGLDIFRIPVGILVPLPEQTRIRLTRDETTL